MNIFVLDKDPKICASFTCDKHVVKQTLETTQLLSTTLNICANVPGPYKSTHINHPCAKWSRSKPANFIWLTKLLDALLSEYTSRYNKIHKCQQYLPIFQSVIWTGDNHSFQVSEFVQCMPDQYKVPNDPVQAYRNYYLGEKRSFATWKNEQPEWWK